jgi:hypothetical protein
MMLKPRWPLDIPVPVSRIFDRLAAGLVTPYTTAANEAALLVHGGVVFYNQCDQSALRGGPVVHTNVMDGAALFVCPRLRVCDDLAVAREHAAPFQLSPLKFHVSSATFPVRLSITLEFRGPESKLPYRPRSEGPTSALAAWSCRLDSCLPIGCECDRLAFRRRSRFEFRFCKVQPPGASERVGLARLGSNQSCGCEENRD